MPIKYYFSSLWKSTQELISGPYLSHIVKSEVRNIVDFKKGFIYNYRSRDI